MGLTIHYSGRLRDAASLENLIQEVEDACRAHNWKSFVLKREFPNHLFSTQTELDKVYGISFSPADCEPVFLSFLSNGKMINPISIQHFGHSQNENEQNWMYSLFTKTQYAGAETHKKIILLLKYLNDKYFEDFKMNDETEYWDTGDDEKLIATFKKHDSLIDNVALGFETLPQKNDEGITDYVERVAKRVQRFDDEQSQHE